MKKSLSNTVALILVLVSVIILQTVVYLSGFVESSGDSFYRALMAYKWSEEHYLVTREYRLASLAWFTPYAWLTGLAYTTTGYLVFSLKAVSFVSSLLGLVTIYLFVRKLINDKTAVLSVFLVGWIPFHVWLSISMVETTLNLLFVLVAILFMVQWFNSRKPLYMAITAFAVLGASMIRPESWLFVVMLNVYLGYLFFTDRTVSKILIVFAGMVSISFIVFWMADNWIVYRNPVYFISANKEYMSASDSVDVRAFWMRALQLPFFILVLSPLLSLVSLLGIILKWKSFNKIIWIYLCSIFVYVLLLLLLFVLGLGADATPQRYGLLPLVLMVPFASWLIADSYEKGRMQKISVVSFMVLLSVTSIAKSLEFPKLYTDAAAMGMNIKSLVEQEYLDDKVRIATDFDLQYLGGNQRPSTMRDFLVSSSEHAALAAYSENPKYFLTDPLYKGSISEGPRETEFVKLKQFESAGDALQKAGVNTVIVSNRALMDSLPENYRVKETTGKYAVFNKPQSYATQVSYWEQSESPDLSSEWLTMTGHHYVGWLYPVSLVIKWRVGDQQPINCHDRVLFEFKHAVTQGKIFIQDITPILCRYDLNSGQIPKNFEDVLAVDLPMSYTSGEYNVRMAVVSPELAGRVLQGSSTDVDWQQLTPIYLGFSKRDALKEYITGDTPDWIAFIRLLLSL